MTFVSFSYLVFLGAICLLFYVLPVKYRKWLLLPASLFFFVAGSGWLVIWLIFTTLVAWGYGICQSRGGQKKKLQLFLSILFMLLPLISFKWGGFLWGAFTKKGSMLSLVAPMGISFYTLSLISYCMDIYRGKTEAQRNFWKLLLFSSFFPHIVQGPIARYDELERTLYQEKKFDYDDFCKGVQLIVWGYIQKLVIADRAAILVDNVFTDESELKGMYVLIAFVTYSIQLYADFSGCVNIAKGSAQLFGIRLADNFKQPYFADSIQDFWRRWHISLSTWLRDYVYIPLGGNRKGKIRKYLNVMAVFAISGLWHGTGFHYFVWGLLHGFYQVVGQLIRPLKKTFLDRVHISDGKGLKAVRVIITFGLVTLAWGIFRADSVGQFCHLLKNMVSAFNPQILLSDGAFELIGIRRISYLPVLVGTVLMFMVDLLHERGIRIRDEIARLDMPVRWVIYIGAVMSVIILGVYGPGYSAAQFIYGQY